MRIIIDVIITKNGHHYSLVRREHESNLVPIPSMEIWDSAWKNERKIKAVTIGPNDPDGEYYYLYVESDDDRDSDERCKELEDMYISHGWKNTAGLMR